jgi:hypothetical protein
MVHARRCLVYWRRAAFLSGFFLLCLPGITKITTDPPLLSVHAGTAFTWFVLSLVLVHQAMLYKKQQVIWAINQPYLSQALRAPRAEV